MSISDEIDFALCEYGCTHLTPYIMDNIKEDSSLHDIKDAVSKVLRENDGTVRMFRDVMYAIESCKYKLERVNVKETDTVQDVLFKMTNAIGLYLLGKNLDANMCVNELLPVSIEVRFKDEQIRYIYLCF